MIAVRARGLLGGRVLGAPHDGVPEVVGLVTTSEFVLAALLPAG